jgi:hypothetical protein
MTELSVEIEKFKGAGAADDGQRKKVLKAGAYTRPLFSRMSISQFV